MTTASDRIPLVGLSLADAYEITDQLRARSVYLRELSCKLLASGQLDVSESDAERERNLNLRGKINDAIARTLGDLG